MVITGSYSLHLRGLLNRKVQDIDVCGIKYNEKLYKFCKKLGFTLDFIDPNNFEFEWYEHKNRYIKITPLHIVLFYKFKKQRKIDLNPHLLGMKHYNDLIHIFYTLGKEKSIEEINKMDLTNEERAVILEWVEISNSNDHVN